jgi:hypothetical protein
LGRSWRLPGPCFCYGLFIFTFNRTLPTSLPRRSKLDQLLERVTHYYDNLRDLRFEFRSGKYAENDYEAMKTSLE